MELIFAIVIGFFLVTGLFVLVGLAMSMFERVPREKEEGDGETTSRDDTSHQGA